MEIEYQLSKKDYIKFNKLYIKDSIRKNRMAFIVFVLILLYALSGKYSAWWEFLLATIISPLITYTIFYLLPFFISLVRLNKALSKDQSGLERKKLNITDEGLLIESASKTTIRKWESIISVHSNTGFIYIALADKKIVPFPKKAFEQDSDAINFLGVIQTKIIKLRGVSNFPLNQVKRKPNYLLGLLGLIPIVGGVVGVILVADGISKYRDKWLIIIGTGCIIISAIFIYTLINNDSFDFRPMMVKQSQMQINSLMKAVEFYKIKNGVYPDSLSQVSNDNSDTWTFDPLQSGGKQTKHNEYNYQKVGSHYYLFSSGIDRIPGTKDDIYPQVGQSDSAKFGLIHK